MAVGAFSREGLRRHKDACRLRKGCGSDSQRLLAGASPPEVTCSRLLGRHLQYFRRDRPVRRRGSRHGAPAFAGTVLRPGPDRAAEQGRGYHHPAGGAQGSGTHRVSEALLLRFSTMLDFSRFVLHLRPSESSADCRVLSC